MSHDDNHVRWTCSNPNCGCSVVGVDTLGTEIPPRCLCGSPMEKVESIPVFTYLDFLRGDISDEK